jgi:hypothetical protein
MTAFKVFFLGIVTFMEMAGSGKYVFMPNASGGRVVGNRTVERHVAYVMFRMEDYLGSVGWGAPNKLALSYSLPEADLLRRTPYGFYVLDGFTLSMNQVDEDFATDESHCKLIPHLTLECPSASLQADLTSRRVRENVSAEMIVSDGVLLGRATVGGARISELDLHLADGTPEIVLTATSFDGLIVRKVRLRPQSTIWIGNEWSGKFTDRAPRDDNHWLLQYLLSGSTDCRAEPFPIIPACEGNAPLTETSDSRKARRALQRSGSSHAHPGKGYSVACSNSNYP